MARGFWVLNEVSDGDLERALRGLIAEGQRTEARIVAHLAEVDARRIHLRAGSPSLFAYCLKRLGLSEMEAFYRITAARLARRFPMIFELLEQGRVHLSGVYAVRRCLTRENHREVLLEIAGKSKREIERLMAVRFPRADVPGRLQPRRAFDALSENRYLLQVTISSALKEKLEHARDLMSHANPDGDLEVILDHAVDSLIRKLEVKRFGVIEGKKRTIPIASSTACASAPAAYPTQAQAPHPTNEAPTASHSSASLLHHEVAKRRQHIKNEVRRAVVARDGQRCSFVAQDGTRCTSRAFLQLHHQQAWAKGGSDEVSNLHVLCAAHNRLLAEIEYGHQHVEGALARKREG